MLSVATEIPMLLHTLQPIGNPPGISFDVEEGKTAVPPDQWEEGFCADLGINYYRMPLKLWSYDHGVIPADKNVEEFLKIMADPKNHPVLVHCFRGVHRTGTYCAIYRMEFQGWSNEEAMEELKALGYDNLEAEATLVVRESGLDVADRNLRNRGRKGITHDGTS